MAMSQGRKRSYLSDVFVLISMALVSSAIGVCLVMQLGYDQAIAGFAAVASFAALSSGHILLRRNDSVARLQRELNRHPNPAEETHSFDELLKTDQAAASTDTDVDLGQYRPSSDRGTGVEPTDASEGLARLQTKVSESSGQASPNSPIPHQAGNGLSNREQIGLVIQRLADGLSKSRASNDGHAAERPGLETAASTTVQPPALPEAAHTPKTDVSEQPPSRETTAGDKLAAIAEALSNERVEVFLEPIHGLEDGAARHYEVTIRLALQDGQTLDHATYSEATRGSAVLPLIDAVKVSHTKRVGLQLLRRGKSGALISQINGDSVREREFGDDLATIMGADQIMAGRLILSFSQADVRSFVPAQWDALERLRSIGFRFAIGEIVDLDMDFEQLAQRGFTFTRLDAQVFRQGLRLGEMLVPPTDICRHLAMSGLTLIVDHLTTDRDVAEVFGFGVLFGQGMLFGGPRTVKAHVLREDQPGAPTLATQSAVH